MVQVLTGPDSNLYVVVLNGSGSQVRRIRYVGAGNTPPTAVANATPDHRHRAADGRVLERGLVRSRRAAALLQLELRRRQRAVDAAEPDAHLHRVRASTRPR